ncbi:uncharacterized protein [Apostichopus japonicus]|uniref:uncharacterized protein n=1 Tax=Stichopus japonicus TaxID=307972 RepID=UPI003AB84567
MCSAFTPLVLSRPRINIGNGSALSLPMTSSSSYPPIVLPTPQGTYHSDIWQREAPESVAPIRFSNKLEDYNPLVAGRIPAANFCVPGKLRDLLETSFVFGPPRASVMLKRRKRLANSRRKRTTFSVEQTTSLEEEYERAIYVSRSKRLTLARELDLTERQIKIWFQNRRAKDKRIEKARQDHILGPRDFHRFGLPHQHLSCLRPSSLRSYNTAVEHNHLATSLCPICSLNRADIAPSV